jgi:flagellar motor switch protein FliG
MTPTAMPLTGPEKAVLMLLSLDEATAAPIVAELDDVELRKLREVAAMMRGVPASAIEMIYREFVDRAQEAVAVPKGGVTYLKRLASRALGEGRLEGIFMDAPVKAMERLAHADPVAVAGVLENELPQMVAAVLSQVEPGRAARILEALPADKQAEVLARLGALTEVPAGLLEGVASAIAAELPTAEAEAPMSVHGVTHAAAVVRKLSKQAAGELLERISTQEGEVANEIRRAMYTFEDLKEIDVRALRNLLKEVPSDRLVLALKTASETVKNKIFSSMSARAGELLKDDLSALGSVRLVEVEAAQREIVESALKLEAEGVISLGGGGDDMV